MRPKWEELGRDDRISGGWRAIGSAWALVLVVVLLFAGVSAIAAHSRTHHRQAAALSQVVIPRHDAACAVPASCKTAPDQDPGVDW